MSTRLYKPGQSICAVDGFSSRDFTKHKYLRIYHADYGGGFFVNLLYVINGILFAQRNNLIPFVYISDPKLPFYDSLQGENIWEYYFEPITDINYRTILPEEVCEIVHKQIASHRFHEHYRHGIQVYPYKAGIYSKKRFSYDSRWYLEMRKKANKIINQYIRIKPEILRKIDNFVQQKFYDNHMLGVHVRATDKLAGIGGRQILSEEYFPHIDRYLDENPRAKIFCATDSPRELKKMIARYADSCCYYDALRDEHNIFKLSLSSNYRKGEDALIDSLLLSKCNFLIKSSSAVSEFSVYFNLGLHNKSLDLQYCGNYG